MTGADGGLLAVNADRLRRDIETVASFGGGAGGGVSRTSFSAADRQVRAWLAAEADRAGLTLRTDPIGNVFVRLDAPSGRADAAAVWTGSHLDSVPMGGRLDGVLGSLAALEVARRLAEERVSLARPVEAVVFADEEGNYHHLLGSTALVRNFTPEELASMRGRDGDALADALTAMGWDPAAATSTRVPPDRVHAFVELHIEQGAVLETANTDIGVVTGIVGLGGGHLDFLGRQDHAGTTPMGLRRDALRGAAALITELPAVAASVSPDAVVTVGRVEVAPGAGNVVPGAARLQVDFRDPDRDRMELLEKAVVAAAERAAYRHDTEVRYHRDSLTDPVLLEPAVKDLIEASATRRGLSTLRMPSGAGHDAQNIATLAATGMIFIPSAGGRSHSPAEHSRWEDIMAGANVLLSTVHALAGS